MKVLHVTTHFNIGGISNYILSLSKALKDKGVSVTVASSGGNLESELEKYDIPHRRLNIKTKFEFGPKVFISAAAVSRIVKSENIDLMHAHTRVSQAVCFFASLFTSVPYVTTCHGFFKKRLRKVFDTWGRKVIAISEPVRRHLEEDLGVRSDRITLVHSGVDTERFSKSYSPGEINRMKEMLGLKDAPVVGAIGRLSSVKGHRFLIRAMADIMAKRPNAQLLVVGDGEEDGFLKSLAASSGVINSVHFLASDPDTAKMLSVMDVFVFPSVKEGLGIALLEAMAAGRPCVASNVGGIVDIIQDGHNGLLVDAQSPGQIAGAVLKLLNDTDLSHAMGERARALVKDKFPMDKMSDGVIKVYRDIVKG